MSEPAQTVPVHLRERTYDIEIGQGHLEAAGRFLSSRRPGSRAVIITDETVAPLYVQPLVQSLGEARIGCETLVVPPGEPTKSVEQASRLWNEMLAQGADRQSVVIALGGGVIGDLAGFVAATFARGLPLMQIPTTLLAQVDSSVGGKVGVNLPRAKNMVGAFWQPLGVLVDTNVLSTLDDRNYRAGMAEVVKYGVILDADFFDYLHDHSESLIQRDPHTLIHVVARCCQLKATVVEQDEREETGHRAVLNYGHTFCHALEAATGYGQFLHGEAVAIGMVCASRLAERLGRIGADLTERQRDLLDRLGLPTRLPDIPHDQLIDLMRHDKKAAAGKLRFVLPARIGHVELVGDVKEEDVRAALAT